MNNIEPTKPNKRGRPSKYTEKTVKALEAIHKLAITDAVACSHVRITRETYYSWLKTKPEFSDRMTKAKNYARIAAGSVVTGAIKDKDVSTARWWLEKKHSDEFKSGGSGLIDSGGGPIQVNVTKYDPEKNNAPSAGNGVIEP